MFGIRHYNSRWLVILALLLAASLFAWQSKPIIDQQQHTLTALIERLEVSISTIGKQFPETELSGIQQYKRAIQSFNRARLLRSDKKSRAAIPHAESALALLESTREVAYRNRFNKIKATVVDQQLSAAGMPANNSVALEAEIAFQQAMKSYQQQDWDLALDRITSARELFDSLLDLPVTGPVN